MTAEEIRPCPFTLTGHVVRGKQLGSKLGFPTANIVYNPEGRNWPCEGVYVGLAEVEADAHCYVCILNQGMHPTAPEGAPTVEAHLLGHGDHELYGKRLTLSYLAFLRPETAFPSLAALKAQLKCDREVAIRWFTAHRSALCNLFPTANIKEPE